MVKKKKKVNQCFQKHKMTFLNILFCPQPKDMNFTVIEEERNKNILMFNKLEAVLWFVS